MAVEADYQCEACGAAAIVRFGEGGTERITLVYWKCKRCSHPNAAAFDWEVDDLVAAEPGHMTKGKWVPYLD